MDNKLADLMLDLENNRFKIIGTPKVNDRFFLISNGWGNTYRYVTLRIHNDNSRIVSRDMNNATMSIHESLKPLKETLAPKTYNRVERLIRACLREGLEVEVSIPKK
jgi:hypothetical protein